MATPQQFDALARLLTYPDDGYRDHLATCRRSFAGHPEAAEQLRRFARQIGSISQEELRELYTRTFDLNPVCSLEVGWHLFGENYSRGEFLVEMRQTLRRLGLPETTELPDHLSQVLPAMARLKPREADRFCTQCLLPVLAQMLAGLAGQDCPYETVLLAIQTVVLSPYGAVLDSGDACCVACGEEVAHG